VKRRAVKEAGGDTSRRRIAHSTVTKSLNLISQDERRLSSPSLALSKTAFVQLARALHRRRYPVAAASAVSAVGRARPAKDRKERTMMGLKTHRNNTCGDRGIQAQPKPDTFRRAMSIRPPSIDPCRRMIRLREYVMRDVVRVPSAGGGPRTRTDCRGRQQL
jgi:hypothetical protein